MMIIIICEKWRFHVTFYNKQYLAISKHDISMTARVTIYQTSSNLYLYYLQLSIISISQLVV